MTIAVSEDMHRLSQLIGGLESVIVAYSGGVDSAVVLAAAYERLKDRAVGIIAESPALPRSELSDALDLAASNGWPVRVIRTSEYLNPEYAANKGDRCFHCRSHLFEQLTHIADSEGFNSVVDGVHADDIADHVGGMRAARRFGVRSPLLELGITKNRVRAVASLMNLSVQDKPAAACLASRIPVGTAVTVSLLERIGAAEQMLQEMGFYGFRVRHHGNLARIEMPREQTSKVMESREKIVVRLRSLGYEYVTLDLLPRGNRSVRD